MTSKRSNDKFFKGLAVALLLPLTFYIIFTVISRHAQHMPPYYAIERIDSVNNNGKWQHDTVYHQVADLQFTNQLGHHVSLNGDLKGKVLVVSFIYTHSPAVSPMLMHNLDTLQTAFKKDAKNDFALDSSFQIISFTVDPANDSFPALRKYADSYKVNLDHWWLGGTDQQSVYDFAARQLFLPMKMPNGAVSDSAYSHQLVLIDKNRNIRGYYDGLNPHDVNQCANDIVLLIFQNEHKKH